MAPRGQLLRSVEWFVDALSDGGSVSAFVPAMPGGDRMRSRIANQWLFGAATYSQPVVLTPEAGYIAYAVSATTAQTSEDSVFAYLGFAPAHGDQCSPPTEYDGGELSWETAGAYMTGRLGSYTGTGSGIITVRYWRAATQAWSEITITLQAGAVVSAFSVAPAGVAQVQAIGNVVLGLDDETLVVDGLTQQQAIAEPALAQIHELGADDLYQAQAVEGPDTSVGVTYTVPITLNPPAGYAALPIAAASASTATNSVLYNSGFAPADGDQLAVPTEYAGGGTITWELSGTFATGRIGSYTGSGEAVLSVEYWRAATGTWSTIHATMDGGAIVQPGTLVAQSLAQQQFVEGPAAYEAITYSRAITLNPPDGYTQRPVLAAAAVSAPYSFFSLLGFAPADGDQVVTPDAWDDDGTPRAIVWGDDGAGHPTGVIVSVAGSSPPAVTIEYWRAVNATWSSVEFALIAPGDLGSAGIAQQQFIGQPTLTQTHQLQPASITQQQAVANAQIAVGGAPVKYTRSITLLPPVGRQAFPIDAETVDLSQGSIFQFLVGSPVTGDQAAPPIIYTDVGGVQRAITWETVGGTMTGRIAEIEGTGLTALAVPYWDSTTATWYIINATLQDAGAGLVVQSITQAQAVAAPALNVQRVITPAAIVQQQVLFSSQLSLSFTVLPHSITQQQMVALAGLGVAGTLGAFPIITEQFFSQPTLAQTNELAVQPLAQVQALGVVPINGAYSIEPQRITQEQVIYEPALVSVSILNPDTITQRQFVVASSLSVGFSLQPDRLDQRQYVGSPVVNLQSKGTITATFLLYPSISGKIFLRSG